MQRSEFTEDLQKIDLEFQQELSSMLENITLLQSYKKTNKGYYFIPEKELEIIKKALLLNISNIGNYGSSLKKMAQHSRVQREFSLDGLAKSILSDVYRHLENIKEEDRAAMRRKLGIKERVAA